MKATKNNIFLLVVLTSVGAVFLIVPAVTGRTNTPELATGWLTALLIGAVSRKIDLHLRQSPPDDFVNNYLKMNLFKMPVLAGLIGTGIYLSRDNYSFILSLVIAYFIFLIYHVVVLNSNFHKNRAS